MVGIKLTFDHRDFKAKSLSRQHRAEEAMSTTEAAAAAISGNENPGLTPVGMRHLIANRVPLMEDGKLQRSAIPGKPVRRPSMDRRRQPLT
jgi:hypothetical protein